MSVTFIATTFKMSFKVVCFLITYFLGKEENTENLPIKSVLPFFILIHCHIVPVHARINSFLPYLSRASNLTVIWETLLPNQLHCAILCHQTDGCNKFVYEGSSVWCERVKVCIFVALRSKCFIDLCRSLQQVSVV